MSAVTVERACAPTRRNKQWRTAAVCAGAPDPERFAPVISAPGAAAYRGERDRAAATAAEFCAGCPVLDACGVEADARREQGVWGGALRTYTPQRGGYRADLLIPAARSKYGAVR